MESGCAVTPQRLICLQVVKCRLQLYRVSVVTLLVWSSKTPCNGEVTSLVFPQPCFLNSAALLTLYSCMGSWSSFCCRNLPVIYQQEYVRTRSAEVLLFPVLGVGVLQVYSLLTVLVCWTSGPSCSGPLIWSDTAISHDPLHHQQRLLALLLMSLPSASSTTNFVCPHVEQLQGNTPSGIPACLHLFSSIISASGWEMLKFSLHHDLTPCFSLSIANWFENSPSWPLLSCVVPSPWLQCAVPRCAGISVLGSFPIDKRANAVLPLPFLFQIMKKRV